MTISSRRTIRSSAFTIVELLVVIVVIGILASISVMSYNGFTNRAKNAALLNATKQAGIKLETMRTFNNSYPATVTASDFNLSSTQTLDYQKIGQNYCLTISDPSVGSSFIANTGAHSVGPCPVAYFPLDGNAEDKSAYQNNGTNNGATTAIDRDGKANGALGFNGIGNYVNLTNTFWSDKFNDLPGNTTNFSISAWINLSAYPSESTTIVGQQYSTAMVFGVRPSGSLYLRMDDAQVSNSNTSVPLNTWRHVTIVFTGNASASSNGIYYINGVQDGSGGVWDGSGSGNNSNTFIGWQSRPGTGADSYFPGSIDDVRIFNKALTEKEVKQLYEAK